MTNVSASNRAHAQPKQKRTVVYDFTSKAPLSNVMVWVGEINKHVSDGVNQLSGENKCDLTKQKTLPTDEAKDFSKFEAKLAHFRRDFNH